MTYGTRQSAISNQTEMNELAQLKWKIRIEMWEDKMQWANNMQWTALEPPATSRWHINHVLRIRLYTRCVWISLCLPLGNSQSFSCMLHVCIGHLFVSTLHSRLRFRSIFDSHSSSLMLAFGLWNIKLNRLNAFETKIIL